MFIQLSYRYYGIHSPIKHIEIPCKFNDVFLFDNYINEELLLNSIPNGWLPVGPEKILLTKADEYGSTGQCGLCIFRSWGKYFDSYVLDLYKKPLEWWAKC